MTMDNISTDIAIVGGGIYGTMLWMEAVRRGLNCALFERTELCSGISNNSFRTLHGGLRHLQRLDLPHFVEGVRERAWFLQHFPEHSTLRRFVMPLDGRGVNRPAIMRLAGVMNNALTTLVSATTPQTASVPSSGTALMQSFQCRLPWLTIDQISAAFYWFDGEITDLSGLIGSVKAAVCAHGGQLFEHCSVERVERDDGHYELQLDSPSHRCADAQVVIDTTPMWRQSPSCELLGSQHFAHYPSLGWNVVLNRPAVSEDAIVLYAEDRSTFFLRNHNGQLYVGTAHVPVPEDADQLDAASFAAQQMSSFFNKINAVTGLNLNENEVAHIEAGLLPVVAPGTTEFATRPSIQTDAAAGYYQLSGVKLTSARAVANNLITKIAKQHFPGRSILSYGDLLQRSASALG